MSVNFDWGTIGSVATAIAVLLAGWQLRRGAVQARTDFEDDLSREYRALARTIPTTAHLGDKLSDDAHVQALSAMFGYVDLTNEQIFLRLHGRVSKPTWTNWCEGIRVTLGKPAFDRAWREIKEKSGSSFSELKRLEGRQFAEDPRTWAPWRTRFADWVR